MPEIHVLKTRPAEVNESTVKVLEGILELARAGKIVSVAIATVSDDNCTGRAWSQTDSYGMMLGSITLLSHDYASGIDNGRA